MILAAPVSRKKAQEDWLGEGNGEQGADFWLEGGNGEQGADSFTEGGRGQGTEGSGTARIRQSAGLSGTGPEENNQNTSAGNFGGQPEEPAFTVNSYEAFLENRVKEMLAKVEGVGEVDVLIVLKSSEQKVYQTDGRTSHSATREQDSAGGARDITQQEEESSTVLIQGNGKDAGGSTGPLLEKELRPEISGIVISAQGGGIPAVKAEITDAMAALFDLPAHKIKVLKRAE